MSLLYYVPGILLAAMLAAILPPTARRWLLLLTSLGFYGQLNWLFLPVLLGVIAVGFIGALLLEKRPPRTWLCAIFVVAALGPLLVYKYLPVWLDGLDHYLPVSSLDFGGYGAVLVPAGLSFFTFQVLSYLIDVHRGAYPADRNPVRFALFISFFPQLLAGPIERYQALAKPLWDNRRPTPDMVMSGLLLIAYGVFLKEAIGDRLGGIVDPAYLTAGSGGARGAVIGFLGFTLQLLADFGGYSLIAVGAGRLFGVELINNFKQPFFAETLTEFWQRWHISLTRWIGDYIYRPLGRFIVRSTSWPRGMKENVTAFITWTTIGIWHGAEATFVLFGAIQASLIVGQKALPHGWLKPQGAWRYLNMLVVFAVVVISFGLIRANTLPQYLDMLWALITLRPSQTGLSVGGSIWPAIAVMLIVEGVARFKPQWRPDGVWTRAALIFILIVAAVLLGDEDGRNFIYFRF